MGVCLHWGKTKGTTSERIEACGQWIEHPVGT